MNLNTHQPVFACTQVKTLQITDLISKSYTELERSTKGYPDLYFLFTQKQSPLHTAEEVKMLFQVTDR